MSPKAPAQTPEYFATIQDRARYVDACLEKITEWRDHATSHGLTTLWMRKLSNYYGVSDDSYSSQRVIPSGTEGELSNIKVNDLHTLVRDQLIVVTSQRPAGIAKAINSDTKSLEDARIGTAVAEYYLSQAGWEQKFVNGCEIGLVVDECYFDLIWNKSAGDPVRPDVDPETGQPTESAEPLMSGDAQLRFHCPWNAARDPSVETSNSKWNIFSILTNRFDLAAEYPEFSEQILAAAQDNCKQMKLQERKGDDNVYVHLVIHDRTPAVKKGRYSLIVGDVLIADMELPFPNFPVDRLSPEDVIDGPTGYCPSNDVMAMEQVTDALHSIITTNNITFGGQSIVGPALTGVVISEVAKGLRYFEVNPDFTDKIKPLQLTSTAPETFKYIDTLSGKKQSALGSVTGTLQQQATQGASGSAMALIQAQAVQANSGTQRSYFRTLSSVMTKLIGILRVYADTPRVARIVGKSKSQGLKEFKYTGKDLDSISSIVYEMVNPVSQTVGGRMQLAEMLLSKEGLITNPRQILTLITTGNMDALIDPDEAAELLILAENEKLSEGEPVQAIVIENHANHIKGHMATLASTESKQDPKLVETVMAHIQNHLDLWLDASTKNPAILLATNQQPLPPMPMPAAPPPGGQPQGPGGKPPQGPPTNPNEPTEANKPGQPKLPFNPATGERAQVPGAPAA